MKKLFYILICLPIFIFAISGCNNSSIKMDKNKADTKKIENTTNIVIGYGTNNYAALINNKTEVKHLEDLFNSVEFDSSDESIQQPFLCIAFYGKNGVTSFYIDSKDTIQLGDGSYMRTNQIKFKELLSIYDKYRLNKK